MVNPGLARRKSKEHEKQTAGRATTRTGKPEKKDKEGGNQVGGIVLALLLFVVIGSAVIQIINNARNALMYGEQVRFLYYITNISRLKWNKLFNIIHIHRSFIRNRYIRDTITFLTKTNIEVELNADQRW